MIFEFDRSTLSESYSWTQNMSSMIKPHSKKVVNKDVKKLKSCHCRVKSECPLNIQFQVTDIIYKCTVLSPDKPNKVYLGTAEGDFKKRFYNHRKSFNNEGSANDTTLSKYIWELKETSNSSPTLVRSIAKKVPPYSNISKKCLLCLHGKLEIIGYPRPEELFNKRSELISKCRHTNKFLLRKYKTKHFCSLILSLSLYIYTVVITVVIAGLTNVNIFIHSQFIYN